MIIVQSGRLMEVLKIGTILTHTRRATVMPPIHVQSCKEVIFQNQMLFLVVTNVSLLFSLLIQVYHAGTGTPCPVAGQHTSFQRRDSHGMRIFDGMIICTL